MPCEAKEGCVLPVVYKNLRLCKKHYDRHRTQGSADAEPGNTRGWTLDQKLQRFRIVPADPDGCYGWAGAVFSGYGHLWVGTRAHGWQPMAHRVAYAHEVGPIPDGYHIDHECHNRDRSCAGGTSCLHRQCTRADHLRAVPRLDNMRDAVIGLRPGGGKERYTHCKYGHPLSGDNLYLSPPRKPGHAQARVCRACSRARTARWQARQRLKA
jgi:HNH endonuclease